MNEVDSTELSEVPENPATGDPTSSDAIPAGNTTLPDTDLSKTATFHDPVGTTDLFLLENNGLTRIFVTYGELQPTEKSINLEKLKVWM